MYSVILDQSISLSSFFLFVVVDVSPLRSFLSDIFTLFLPNIIIPFLLCIRKLSNNLWETWGPYCFGLTYFPIR